MKNELTMPLIKVVFCYDSGVDRTRYKGEDFELASKAMLKAVCNYKLSYAELWILDSLQVTFVVSSTKTYGEEMAEMQRHLASAKGHFEWICAMRQSVDNLTKAGWLTVVDEQGNELSEETREDARVEGDKAGSEHYGIDQEATDEMVSQHAAWEAKEYTDNEALQGIFIRAFDNAYWNARLQHSNVETLAEQEEARLQLARKLIAIDETEATYNQVYNVTIGGLDCGKVGPALSRAKAVRHAMITHGIKSASIVQVSRFDTEQGINATMTFFDCEISDYHILKYRDRQWQI